MIENPFKRVGKSGRPPIPRGEDVRPKVEAKIVTALAELDSATREYGPAALAAELDIPGAAEAFAEVRARREAAERRLSDLRLALDAAEEQDQQKWAAQRKHHASTQLASVRRHLKSREDAARRLSIALENAVSAWRDLVDATDRAIQANPLGGSWPYGGTTTSIRDLENAVKSELWRLSGRHPLSIGEPQPFPGATPRSPLEYDKGLYVPLSDLVERGNNAALEQLADRPAMAAAARGPSDPSGLDLYTEAAMVETQQLAEAAQRYRETGDPGQTRSADEIMAEIRAATKQAEPDQW